MKPTGERFVPGLYSKRMEADHGERYKYTSKFVMGKNVLDIACGSGVGSKILKDAGAEYVDGVDNSKEAIEYAQENYSADGVDFILADADEYYPDKKYDVIVSFESIEHFQFPERVLRNFYKLLKDDGRLIISTVNRIITNPGLKANQKPEWDFHFREFDIPELSEELVKAGFTKQRLMGQRHQLYFKNRYLRRLYLNIFKPNNRPNSEPQDLKKWLQPRFVIIDAAKK